jgi:2-(1,2-epoxy-1,2-dihydrophenyl)acetyl-CoA isomerase
MSEQLIEKSIVDGIATLTLNRPQRANSINRDMRDQLLQAVKRLFGQSGVRALVITGTGKAFCAGQDLQERYRQPGDEPPDLGSELADGFSQIVRTIADLPIPVIAAVNGVAAGAGANLALACDLVVAVRSATFIQSFTRVGLIPDSGGTYFLPRQVGRQRAAGLALLAESVDATQAEAWGMIWKCVDDDALNAEVNNICDQICAKPPLAISALKRALRLSVTNGLESQLAVEQDMQRALGRSDDYREAVAAFIEKRQPEFNGS